MQKEPKTDLDNDDFGIAQNSTGRDKLSSPRTSEELDALLRERIPDAIMGHSLSAKAVVYELRKLIGKDEMMITDCKYAPQIQGYIDMLKRNDYGGWGKSYSYDNKTYELVNDLFSVLENVQPREISHGRKIWRLWLKADRGPIEAFGDFREMQEYGDVETYDEYEELWKELYPNEVSWFSFAAVDDREISCRAIFLSHKHVIEVESTHSDGFPQNISPFAQWLLDAVQNCVTLLRAGEYNRRIAAELPSEKRTGTILRRALWDIFPGWREEFFHGVSREEIAGFEKHIEEKDPEDAAAVGRLKRVTANDFYGFCAMGYRANHYSGEGLPPKDWYRKHADGRDDGLSEIDPDSPEAFAEWLTDRKLRGGHPWEVCRGGNSTHVSLMVASDQDGYYLILAGSAWTRCLETIRFYLTLRNAGLPVILRDGKPILDRLLERDKLGIVPDDVMPDYCEGVFPEERVLDFIHLPAEKRDEVLKCCSWYPESEVALAKTDDIHPET